MSMATYTPNFNLKKPASSDLVSIADINGNMDIIDTALAGAGGGAEIHSNLSASSWTADSTYTGFGYRCALAITGVTANDVAEVVFAQSEAASGNYASVCETYAGGVYIYSAVNTSITIPTILIFKA